MRIPGHFGSRTALISVPDVRLSFSKPHPATPKEGEEQTRCVNCHLPEGWWNATYAYTHFASMTDLFGHFRDRDAEKAGE